MKNNNEPISKKPGPYTEDQKLGVALVGLGQYSTGQLGPALKETLHCYLAGVTSGSAEKREKWKTEYNLKDTNLYSYENFDQVRDNPDIDIVYIVLPNSLHAEFAIRAAQAGKHVICEKPMATSVEDCQLMIEACKKAGVKLAIGYRLHFDHFNREMKRLGHHNVMGKVRKIIADDSMDIGDKNQWRMKGKMSGGGPLMNNGVYCIQGAQYISGEVPIAVTAAFIPKTNPDKFDEVEEGIRWEMEFASGIHASCESSYSRNGNLLRAEAEHGWFELSPAYEYEGLKGRTSNEKMDFPKVNQQAVLMDDFAICLKNNEESRVAGEMGLRDLIIISAVYQSARTRQKVALDLEDFKAISKL